MDDWIWVRGKIVGWLDKTEHGEYVNDQDIAVVLVQTWKYAGNESLNEPRTHVPVCILRWMGNDFNVIVALDEFNVNIGDIIEFRTDREEQEKYAER
jgi:hypothetical protein